MMKPLSPLLILQSAGILFLFSDYSWSIVNLYVSSGSTAYANVDSVLIFKVKDRRTEFAADQCYRNISQYPLMSWF